MSIRQMRLAVDRKATDEQLRAALEELCVAELVRWDEENEVVWVVNALKRQAKGASPTIGTCVANHLETIPPSPLLDEFYERYHDWLVRAGVVDPDDAPPLRVVDGGASKPSSDSTGEGISEGSADPFGEGSGAPTRNPSGDPIQIPYPDTPSGDGTGISVTETVTETEPESRGLLRCSSSRQTRARDDDDRTRQAGARSSPGAESYVEAEAAVRKAFEKATALAVGPGAYRWAMERWQKGDASLDEILRVVDWWRCNRELADCQLRECFMAHGNGARWPRVEAIVLGRTPAPSRSGGGRGGGGAESWRACTKSEQVS